VLRMEEKSGKPRDRVYLGCTLVFLGCTLVLRMEEKSGKPIISSEYLGCVCNCVRVCVCVCGVTHSSVLSGMC
jgi:hypothetical protein